MSIGNLGFGVDDTDGDITDKITISNNIDTSYAGVYSVVYNVSDLAGNQIVLLEKV